jgi:putative membrane protein
MSALAAFVHHLAAFALVAALAIQFVLIRDELTARSARRIRIADAVFGAASGVLVVVGLLRVFYLEKGAAYYFHNAAFLAKLALFIAVGLLSIYPTRIFLRWRKAGAPGLRPGEQRRLRRVIHWELAGVVLIVLCAALMARGVGQFR